MEFSPRGFQRNEAPKSTFNAPKEGAVTSGGAPTPNDPNKRSVFSRGADKLNNNKVLSILIPILFISAVVLFIITIVSLSFGGKESRAINPDNYQTVVMADGQAYFGKISTITNDYISLIDVFYLQGQDLENGNSSQTAARLVKLGCEIHGPQDQMFIYRDQVSYWENLTSDGRVATAIKQFKEENPQGQTCPTTTASPAVPDETNEEATDESTNPAGTQETGSDPTESDTPGTGTETTPTTP